MIIKMAKLPIPLNNYSDNKYAPKGTLPFIHPYIEAEYFSFTSIPLGPNTYFQYYDYDACKTMHIEEIEIISKKNQKCDIEYDDESKTYEIVLINDSYTNPIAVFLLETENISKFSVTQAEELATKLNLIY